MTNRELTTYVEQVSQTKFGKAFEHQAYWNSRLRTTGGRFFPKDCHLDFNPKFESDAAELEKIILHELCHYHLYRAGLGYKHADQTFRLLLKQVGGSRYVPRTEAPKFKYLYICSHCGLKYPRQRRIDTRKYRCGQCHSKLLLLESK